jgi:hypothetical protein
VRIRLTQSRRDAQPRHAGNRAAVSDQSLEEELRDEVSVFGDVVHGGSA